MSDYYPDSSRFGEYDPNVIQGIVGGIPTRSGGSVFNAADYGFSELSDEATNSAAIASALSASSQGDIILLPAGTYAAHIVASYTSSNRTIRGEGIGVTILKPTSVCGALIGNDSNYGNPSNPLSTITAISGNVITVSDGSSFPTPSSEPQYRIGRIQLGNEDSTPVFSVSAYDKTRYISVVMVSRSGNEITLSQPLPSSFADGIASGATFELGFQVPLYGTGIGLEEMTIDGNDSAGSMQVGVAFGFIAGSWAKNVKVLGQFNYGIRFYDSVNVEVRHSWIDAGFGGGTNHGGILYNTTSYGLVEDNIVVNNGPCFEINFGSTSNIFAYNYLGVGILNCNHGTWNSFNLYEGNVVWFTQTDGYFGGSSQETDFRNWMASGIVLSQKRGSRQRNIIGNIIGTTGVTYTSDGSEFWGTPNIGNNGSTGTAQPSMGDWWLDWNTGTSSVWTWTATLTTRTSDTAGAITLGAGQGSSFATALAGTTDNGRIIQPVDGTQGGSIIVTSVVGDVVTFTTYSGTLPTVLTDFIVVPGPSGFQELDLDVAATTDRKVNFYILTGDIPTDEGLGADTIPDSYFRLTKPAYFEGLAWPPYDPFDPQVYDGTEIPAGYLYINGSDPPPSDQVAKPAFSPTSGTYSSAQMVTISTATVGATIRYTTDGTTPTNSVGTVYSGPVSISSTTTLKAIAYDGILNDSDVRSGTFTITTSDLPRLRAQPS